MKLLVTPAGPNLNLQMAGQGPAVTLCFGPGGAPTPLTALPLVTTIGSTDQIIIVQNGTLKAITFANFVASISAADDSISLES